MVAAKNAFGFTKGANIKNCLNSLYLGDIIKPPAGGRRCLWQLAYIVSEVDQEVNRFGSQFQVLDNAAPKFARHHYSGILWDK